VATQQQAQQQPQPQKPQRRKGLPLGQWIIIIIFIITIIAFGIATYLILKNQGITQGSTTLTIISIIFGVVVGLLALMFAILLYRYPVTPAVPERPAVSPPSPSTAPTLPSYLGIVGLPPPTDPKTW
jgi:uncharacterized BrkB/YihY/UPF0761 family membrane protein